MAGELVVHLAQSHEGDLLAIGPVDILCVKIAALCYNLGKLAHVVLVIGNLHATGFGPFSHVFSEMCTEKVPGWNVSHMYLIGYIIFL